MVRLVALAIDRRYLMVGMFVAVFIGGLLAFRQLNIEAYPDPTPPMVDIVTQSPGLSSEEIERYITIPIETQVAGIKNLRTIRTISLCTVIRPTRFNRASSSKERNRIASGVWKEVSPKSSNRVRRRHFSKRASCSRVTKERPSFRAQCAKVFNSFSMRVPSRVQALGGRPPSSTVDVFSLSDCITWGRSFQFLIVRALPRTQNLLSRQQSQPPPGSFAPAYRVNPGNGR
jgi:hypothetical protein